MLEGALALAVARHGLTFTKELVLVNGEAFEPHGSTRMQFSCADPDFRAQAITKAIGESRGSVLKNISRVDELHEAGCDIVALRDNGLRVARTVPVDMLD